MKKWFFFLSLMGLTTLSQAQTIANKLEKATNLLLQDAQMQNGSLGIYVADAATGARVFDYNGDKGLAPASSQKIFTAIAGYDLLGQDYRFKTIIGYNGQLSNGILNGDLIIRGMGDPTLGSWRYEGYKPSDVHTKLKKILLQNDIHAINGNVIIDDGAYSIQPMPQGWPWGDMGNYYGAPCWGVNWLENQFDVTFKPGNKLDARTTITKISENLPGVVLLNRTTTAESGSGDQSSILLPPYGTSGIITGTLPIGKNTTASGAIPNPPALFAQQIEEWLKKDSIICNGEFLTGNKLQFANQKIPVIKTVLDTLRSPSMDNIMYYFLQKSINLYGESIAKAISYNTNQIGETEDGVSVIRDFWKMNGIPKNALKMMDGSGLSPQNYDAPSSEVKALLYARKRTWFDAFYKALPTYNGTKMKSGTIALCKAYAGYQKSSDGKTYVFSIIINNYNGGHDALVNKMYRLLDVLK